MNNAVTVALKGSAYRTGLFVFEPALRLGTFYGVRREAFLPLFKCLANVKPANHFSELYRKYLAANLFEVSGEHMLANP